MTAKTSSTCYGQERLVTMQIREQKEEARGTNVILFEWIGLLTLGTDLSNMLIISAVLGYIFKTVNRANAASFRLDAKKHKSCQSRSLFTPLVIKKGFHLQQRDHQSPPRPLGWAKTSPKDRDGRLTILTQPLSLDQFHVEELISLFRIFRQSVFVQVVDHLPYLGGLFFLLSIGFVLGGALSLLGLAFELLAELGVRTALVVEEDGVGEETGG